MKNLSKVLLTLVIILSFNNTKGMEDTINTSQNTINSIDNKLNIKALLKGASVEALSIEKYEKCMKFLNKYPTLQKAVDNFFNTIYDFSIRLFETGYILDFASDMTLESDSNVLLTDKIMLWSKNNNLYKEMQSELHHYSLHCDREGENTTCKYVMHNVAQVENPIPFNCPIIYFEEINNLFNKLHTKLNQQYIQII